MYDPALDDFYAEVASLAAQDQLKARYDAYEAQWFVVNGLNKQAIRFQRLARMHAAEAMRELQIVLDRIGPENNFDFSIDDSTPF